MQDKSTIFRFYNAARAMPTVDRGRLNRALGLAQRKDGCSPYETTRDGCNCPDHVYRPWTICKHQLALILKGAL